MRGIASDYSDDVVLSVSVVMPSRLLDARYTLSEMANARAWLDDRKSEINLVWAKEVDAPLEIMVPKILVPVVEWLGQKKMTRIRERPILPKGKVDRV